MIQDYKLGLRMLLKYPGLTLAGGLALAVAIGVGAVVVYDLLGNDRLANDPAAGRRPSRRDRNAEYADEPARGAASRATSSSGGTGCARSSHSAPTAPTRATSSRGLTVPEGPIQVAELTATAFGAAHVRPLLGRSILEPDERPGAAAVVVVGLRCGSALSAAGRT